MPTVGDADAVMGKLYPQFFAGGDLTLDVQAAKHAIEANRDSFGIDVFDAANSVVEVVDENMVAAAKAHSSEWGKTMNARALVAFGGAALRNKSCKKIEDLKTICSPGRWCGECSWIPVGASEF